MFFLFLCGFCFGMGFFSDFFSVFALSSLHSTSRLAAKMHRHHVALFDVLVVVQEMLSLCEKKQESPCNSGGCFAPVTCIPKIKGPKGENLKPCKSPFMEQHHRMWAWGKCPKNKLNTSGILHISLSLYHVYLFLSLSSLSAVYISSRNHPAVWPERRNSKAPQKKKLHSTGFLEGFRCRNTAYEGKIISYHIHIMAKKRLGRIDNNSMTNTLMTATQQMFPPRHLQILPYQDKA